MREVQRVERIAISLEQVSKKKESETELTSHYLKLAV